MCPHVKHLEEKFFHDSYRKNFSQAAVLGLTVIIISSNIIPLIFSACQHKISLNVSNKGFLCNFEILSLKSGQCFIASDFSSAVMMLCKQ